MRSSALALAKRIRHDIETRKYRRGMYQLKSLLSKVMLLPALYAQARDGCGAFKRDTFDMARDDFSDREWFSVLESTEIRAMWPKLQARRPFWLYTSPGRIGMLARRKLGYPIDRQIRPRLTKDFASSVTQFANAAKRKLVIGTKDDQSEMHALD